MEILENVTTAQQINTDTNFFANITSIHKVSRTGQNEQVTVLGRKSAGPSQRRRGVCGSPGANPASK